MALLPPVGILNYNGVEFDSLTRSSVSAKVEYDESRRTVLWVEYTIEVEGWIGGNTPSDTTLEEYRVKLTKPGMTLYYVSKGMGNNFAINRVGPPLDVAWGPHPELLFFSPLGGRQGCHVKWRVVTRIPECPATARYQGIIALNYEVDVSIDIDGFSTRAITGHVIIAQTRQAFSNRVKDNADRYREKVIPALIPGFQRTVRSFRLSKDRNRLDWNVTDVQLPFPLPDKMTTFQVEQSINSKLGVGFLMWDIRFSGSGNMPAGSSKNDVLTAFLQTVLARIRGLARLAQIVTVKGKDLQTVLPTGFSVSDQIYGKEIRFDYSFRVFNAGSIADILKTTGMFTAIPGTSYITWNKSMAANAVRGNAGLSVPGNEEVLIDLCTPDDKPTTLKPGILPPNNANTNLTPQMQNVLKTDFHRSTGNILTAPEASWISYSIELRTVTNNRVARHKRLPIENPSKYRKSTKGSADPTKAAALVAAQARGDNIPEETAKSEDVIQVLGSPSYEIVLSGMARRIEHKVAVPRIASIQGIEAVQVSADVRHGQDGAVGGVPIHVATWSIHYMLAEKYPTEVPELANPQLRIDGAE